MKTIFFASASLALLSMSATAVPLNYTGIGENGVLDYNDPGIVGTISGGPFGSTSDEATAAQDLLNLEQGESVMYLGTRSATANSWYDYTGTINSSEFSKKTGNLSVDAGWEYVMAKYDGPNAGYVLFYLGGMAAVLPLYPDAFFGYNATTHSNWTLTHYTAFNAVEPIQPLAASSVPDGGATALLLGLGLIGVVAVSRWSKPRQA